MKTPNLTRLKLDTHLIAACRYSAKPTQPLSCNQIILSFAKQTQLKIMNFFSRLIKKTQKKTLEEELISNRTIYLNGKITEELAEKTIASLLFLNHVDSTLPIKLIVNSPGGLFVESIAIIETVEEMRNQVQTHCRGLAGGSAALLIACGMRRSRTATKDSMFIIEKITSEYKSVKSNILKAHIDVIEKLTNYTNQSSLEISVNMHEGLLLKAEDAKFYGLIDKIIETEQLLK